MGNDNILTSGVYQNSTPINGNWDLLKNDFNSLLSRIEKINKIEDNGNPKIIGYKSSLNSIYNTIKNGLGKISFSGDVKPNEDIYTIYLENKYFLENKKSELNVLESTYETLTLTKEI